MNESVPDVWEPLPSHWRWFKPANVVARQAVDGKVIRDVGERGELRGFHLLNLGTNGGKFIVRMGGRQHWHPQIHTLRPHGITSYIPRRDDVVQAPRRWRGLRQLGTKHGNRWNPSWGGITYIGVDVPNTTAPWAPCKRQVDDVALYSRVLSPVSGFLHTMPWRQARPQP